MVTGVAALVWSYYPNLSANELKKIILESAVVYKRKVLLPNTNTPQKTKVKFTELSSTGGIINAYNALKLAELEINNNYNKKQAPK